MISVIVPVYNVEKYIRKCLDSLVNQTYPDLEIILIDDGSTDSSGKICDEYAEKDDRIQVIHQENKGQSIARNIGLQNASGDFIGFVDSDDSIDLRMFEKLFLAIQDVDIAMCGHNIVYDGKVESYGNREVKTLNYSELWREIFGSLNNAVWNKLFRRDLLNGICFDSHFVHGEDLIFNILYLRFAKSGRIVDEPLYNYYKRGNSITTGKFTRRKLLEIESKDEALRLVQQIYPPMENIAKKYCFRARMNIIRHIYRESKEGQFVGELKMYQQYLNEQYTDVKTELRKRERVEMFLYKYCKLLYKVLTKFY